MAAAAAIKTPLLPEKMGQVFSSPAPGLPNGGNVKHDGREAKRMSGKTKGQQEGSGAEKHDVPAPSLKTVKVTLRLAAETAHRLGIESAMRPVSQSAIAEEVLSNYLSWWQFPSEGTDRPNVG
jgi:hypothetical protein